tara:strand:+ start:28457 stop:29044 length:588 start_codon:yes stop_codon:yes gene_type:complete
VHQPVREYFTAEEATETFRELSRDDRRKLVAVARVCLIGTGFAAPDELISEAFVRVSEGRRRWARDKTFLQFLAGVLRSLATDGDFLPEERKLVRRNKGLAIVTSDHIDGVAVEDDHGDREKKIQGEEALSLLEARFAGDDEMELLLIGIRDGLIGEDLQDAIGVDAKRLEALRTRLNRELKKLAAVYGAKEGKS